MRTGITGGEGNEGWCCRVVSTARTVRASRGRHNPLPAVAPRERRDGDASAPPPHGPPTYRERVAVPGWAGLGLSASVKRATWACPSRHRRGTGLYCLRAARRKPDTRRGREFLYIFRKKVCYTSSTLRFVRILKLTDQMRAC